MNQLIAQKKTWGLAELKERSETLRQQAFHIWPRSESTFQPEEKQLDVCDLGEDRNLTGRQLVSFRWRGEEHYTSQWSEMYQNVISWLHAEDPSVLTNLAQNTNLDDILGSIVSTAKPDERSWVEIAPDIWLLTHMSTQAKIVRLRLLFKRYGIDEEELVFSLREENNQGHDDTARHETRLRYWKYALEFIRTAHADRTPFLHSAASKRNYLGCSIGYTGIQIFCVANQNEARVELYLGADKERNKKTFDFLHSHATDIEKNIGHALQWNRNSDMKHSSIVYTLSGVSINDETDWPRMAQFHARESRHFYDVFILILQKVTG